jgi:hypothetical protein
MIVEATMTSLRNAILNAVRAGGDAWQTRLQIAEQLNRPGRLNHYDILILGELERDGLIEISTRISRGAVKSEYIYRANAVK